MSIRRIPFLLLSSVTSVCFLAGCQIGPKLLPTSNSQYGDAVRISQSEQLLANLVRLHYGDLPVFLAVTNISTQFSLTGASALGTGTGGDTPDLTVGFGTEYAERPTISFSILGGEAFQRRLLTPLTVPVISLLVESGWRIDRVLLLTTEALNGLDNAHTASGPTPKSAPEFSGFRKAVTLMETLRGSDQMKSEYRVRRRPIGTPIPVAQVNGGALVDAAQAGFDFDSTGVDASKISLAVNERRLAIRFAANSASEEPVRQLRTLLQLAPSKQSFDVVPVDGSTFDPLLPERSRNEIALDTRSLMGVLHYLSNAVETPEEHLAAGAATTTTTATGAVFDWANVLGDIATIHANSRRPDNAAIAIQYRGYWFYVADNDQTTKATFMLLSDLFALQAGDVAQQQPVLTLPVGG